MHQFDQFKQANRMINKHLTYLRMMAQLIGDSAFDEKGFKEYALETEEIVIGAKRKFIDIAPELFLLQYYFIRGITSEIRDNNSVNQIRLKDALESFFSHTEVFPKIIERGGKYAI